MKDKIIFKYRVKPRIEDTQKLSSTNDYNSPKRDSPINERKSSIFSNNSGASFLDNLSPKEKPKHHKSFHPKTTKNMKLLGKIIDKNRRFTTPAKASIFDRCNSSDYRRREPRHIHKYRITKLEPGYEDNSKTMSGEKRATGITITSLETRSKPHTKSRQDNAYKTPNLLIGRNSRNLRLSNSKEMYISVHSKSKQAGYE